MRTGHPRATPPMNGRKKLGTGRRGEKEKSWEEGQGGNGGSQGAKKHVERQLDPKRFVSRGKKGRAGTSGEQGKGETQRGKKGLGEHESKRERNVCNERQRIPPNRSKVPNDASIT